MSTIKSEVAASIKEPLFKINSVVILPSLILFQSKFISEVLNALV